MFSFLCQHFLSLNLCLVLQASIWSSNKAAAKHWIIKYNKKTCNVNYVTLYTIACVKCKKLDNLRWTHLYKALLKLTDYAKLLHRDKAKQYYHHQRQRHQLKPLHLASTFHHYLNNTHFLNTVFIASQYHHHHHRRRSSCCTNIVQLKRAINGNESNTPSVPNVSLCLLSVSYCYNLLMMPLCAISLSLLMQPPLPVWRNAWALRRRVSGTRCLNYTKEQRTSFKFWSCSLYNSRYPISHHGDVYWSKVQSRLYAKIPILHHDCANQG